MVKKPTAKLSKVKANPVFVLVAADISPPCKMEGSSIIIYPARGRLPICVAVKIISNESIVAFCYWVFFKKSV